MEKINIVVSNDASNYLDDLIEILYRKDYFGFIDSAQNYVSRIYEFIYDNILIFPAKKTPKQLFGYSQHYIFYKINPKTTWYIFFEKSGCNYLVTQIFNNHCEESKYL